jgi:septum formation protein
VISLHLASSSARRVEILTAMGLQFTAEGVDIDETPKPGEQAGAMVLRLAEAKARKAAASHPGLILGSDTAVVLDERIFGKPESKEEALDMLACLSGRCHEVFTAIALIAGDEVLCDLSVTRVCFREIRPDEARQYWQSGEPEGKAGAYAIQGRGGIFVESIAGSYSGVVGLPVYQTAALLQQSGMPVLAAEFEEDAKAV